MSTMTIEQITAEQAEEWADRPTGISGVQIMDPQGHPVWLCGRGSDAAGCIGTAVWGRSGADRLHVAWEAGDDRTPWHEVLDTDPMYGAQCDSCRRAGYTTVWTASTGWLSTSEGLDALTVYEVGADGGTTVSDVPVTVELLIASAEAPEGQVLVDGEGSVLDPSQAGQSWVTQPVRTVWVGR